MFRMTLGYQAPYGSPVYWRNEVSGVIPAAVEAFIEHAAVPENDPPTPEQLTLLKKYFIYYIKAPCWRENAKRGKFQGELDALILKIELAETMHDLQAWIAQCLEIALDPL